MDMISFLSVAIFWKAPALSSGQPDKPTSPCDWNLKNDCRYVSMFPVHVADVEAHVHVFWQSELVDPVRVGAPPLQVQLE